MPSIDRRRSRLSKLGTPTHSFFGVFTSPRQSVSGDRVRGTVIAQNLSSVVVLDRHCKNSSLGVVNTSLLQVVVPPILKTAVIKPQFVYINLDRTTELFEQVLDGF